MNKRLILLAAVVAGSHFQLARAAEATLSPQPAVPVEGTRGKFDYLSVDATNRRLLAGHPGNHSFDIFDLDSGKLIKSLLLGTAQGAVYDSKHNCYYVTLSKEQQVVSVDAATFQVIAQIPVSGPADGILFSPKTGLVYAGHDDGKEVWIINTETNVIRNTAKLGGEGPEGAAVNADGSVYFQNVKKSDTLESLDGATGKSLNSWPTAPATKPHGMAWDEKNHHLIIAGGDGTLAVLDDSTGKVVTSTAMAGHVDQIAFDPDNGNVYCPSGKDGTVTVIHVSGDKAEPVGTLPVTKGAHTIALDPKTHALWIAWGDDNASFIQKLVPLQH